MSAVIPVSADWLSLREPVDARSRSLALVENAGRMLRPPLTIHDLGSGTGSMMRWLAPLLPGPQTWVLHDWNEELLRHAAATAAIDAAGRSVEVQTRVGHLAELREADVAGASLVVTSALLDVLAAPEVEAIVRACVTAAVPALLALSVRGTVELDPARPEDAVFEASFNDHQRRSADGRTLLGPDAVDVAAHLFAESGWTVSFDSSPWRLGPGDGELTAEWLDGWVGAAVEQRPELAATAREYLLQRRAEREAGLLSAVVHHTDLLAWPP
ncbi:MULTISPECIES: SAM-dependent methyltransferase [Microbacterium]|uniref:methyltransferase domain-containing protein n=1 Tax=Microbacterium TaxID=33882 RepID=UPI001469DB88|nr:MULTISPECIES: SAM-dependent methyltransferase [Microbacterium]